MADTKAQKDQQQRQRHPERPDGVWPPVATTRGYDQRVMVGGALTVVDGEADQTAEDVRQTEIKRAEIQREAELAADAVARSADVAVGQTNLTPLSPSAQVVAPVGGEAAQAASRRPRGGASK